MTKWTLMGEIVRDSRSGLTGKVVGIVTWIDGPSSLIVQPPARDDRTVPSSVYVPESSAEVVPQPNNPEAVH